MENMKVMGVIIVMEDMKVMQGMQAKENTKVVESQKVRVMLVQGSQVQAMLVPRVPAIDLGALATDQ